MPDTARTLACIIIGSTLALASGAAPSAAAEPFEVDAILPLTGTAAFVGKQQVDTLHVIEQTVNAEGGIRGRPIKFSIQDDQTNPQLTVQLTNALIANHARVILGPSQSAGCNAIAPLIKNGPVVYCFSPGIYPEAGTFMFSAGMSTASYASATIRFLRDKGWKRIALVTSNDAVGRDGDKVIDGAVDDRSIDTGGVTIVDREHFNATDINVTAQISHVKTSGAQVAIVWTTGTPFATVVRDAFQSGLAIPILAAGGNLDYDQLTSYESFIPPGGLYFISAPWSGIDRLPPSPVRNAIIAYNKKFQALGLRPAQTAALAWDATMIVIDALKKLGLDATPEQIRSSIAGVTSWVGVNGMYNFPQEPQRGAGSAWVVIVRWDPQHRSVIAISKPGGAPL